MMFSLKTNEKRYTQTIDNSELMSDRVLPFFSLLHSHFMQFQHVTSSIYKLHEEKEQIMHFKPSFFYVPFCSNSTTPPSFSDVCANIMYSHCTKFTHIKFICFRQKPKQDQRQSSLGLVKNERKRNINKIDRFRWRISFRHIF